MVRTNLGYSQWVPWPGVWTEIPRQEINTQARKWNSQLNRTLVYFFDTRLGRPTGIWKTARYCPRPGRGFIRPPICPMSQGIYTSSNTPLRSGKPDVALIQWSHENWYFQTSQKRFFTSFSLIFWQILTNFYLTCRCKSTFLYSSPKNDSSCA